MNDEKLKQAGERLAGWQRTLILTHERPDGDALGAAGAMKHIIEGAGRQAEVRVFGGIPARYAFIGEACGVGTWKSESPADLDGQFDGILIVDTSSWSQIEPAVATVRGSSRPRIVLDHHATHNELFGRDAELVTLIDPKAASTCGLICRWRELMGWTLDSVAAEALFTGLITDTGWFRFSNTDAETFRYAAELVQQGIRPEVLYARLYECWSSARLRIKTQMLNTLELLAEERVAVMTLTLKAFEQASATQAETEELVNEPMAIGSIAVSVLLSEAVDGKIRVNLRSKAPDVCGLDVDVAALAQTLGGGGHRRAAGARVSGTLDEIRIKVGQAVLEAVQAAPAEH